MGAYAGEPAGQSIVEGGVIPYKPEALARRKQNFENRMKADLSNDERWHDLGDPEMKCYMPGIPRATYMGFPFQIVQGSSDAILMTYEFASASRVVRMNFKQEAPGDFWMGWSRGRWEGDTLVVDTVGISAISFGSVPHSDRVSVVERIRALDDGAALLNEVTITDPVMYTRPVTVRQYYKAAPPGTRMLEYECAEGMWIEHLERRGIRTVE